MSAQPKKKSSQKKAAAKSAIKSAPGKKTEAKPARVPAPLATQAADVEPTAGSKAVPAIWFAILAALLFWGDMYIMNNGGDLLGEGGSFPPEVYYPYGTYKAVVAANPPVVDLGLVGKGKKAYGVYCVGCHQPNGNGAVGQAPPLAGSEWVLADGPNRIIRIVLDGLTGPIEVKGTTYNLSMLPWRDSIRDDEEIAAILTFIRQEWGNKAAEVDPAKVAEIREATKGRSGRPWTAAELEAIPVLD